MTSSSRSQPVSALLGADLKRVEYANRLLGLDDDALVEEVNRQVWMSAFANNNPRAPAHWKVDLTHDEAGARGKPWLYQRGYNIAFRACGYQPSEAEIERENPPADGPKGQDGPDHSPGMNPDLPTSTQQGSSDVSQA